MAPGRLFRDGSAALKRVYIPPLLLQCPRAWISDSESLPPDGYNPSQFASCEKRINPRPSSTKRRRALDDQRPTTNDQPFLSDAISAFCCFGYFARCRRLLVFPLRISETEAAHARVCCSVNSSERTKRVLALAQSLLLVMELRLGRSSKSQRTAPDQVLVQHHPDGNQGKPKGSPRRKAVLTRRRLSQFGEVSDCRQRFSVVKHRATLTACENLDDAKFGFREEQENTC
ncbi:hypothetical protein C8R45DRAFT_933975 [Mycena sanguinolenta]|nr:hypothetical protein C8R45DRAFT_933975 [Mycena sanguinolenta]